MSARSSAASRSRGATGVQLGELIAPAMILQGSARVFAELGVRAASVADILKAAGISRRTFYRHFDSKEAVMAALYRLGTDRLLDACRRAFQEEQDVLKQIDRCIDAHLRNAKELGRLVFVLGGEAQRTESTLHARRMEVHETLVQLFMSSTAPTAKQADPLIFRAVILALEQITRVMLEEGDEGRRVTDEAIERVRRVMTRIAAATYAGKGPGVPPIPTH
jgi:AcrR family transcriptional regulator